MKHVLILLAFFTSISAFAQPKPVKSVTFKVCDVSPAKGNVPMIPYKQSVDQRCGTGVEAFSTGCDSSLYVHTNAMIEAVRFAYANHRNLTLSPDMIWLMITQEFAIHVDQNSDSLRHYFVDFDGKKVLQVQRDGFAKGSPENNWEGVFPEFTEQIGEYTGQTLLSTSLVNFTTTGAAEKAAMEVTLMDAMSSYFIYAVITITCGIPEITLEGTTQDWETLRDKAMALGKYDFQWWTKELKPVLDQFVDASKGKVDKTFWSQIYDIQYKMEGGGCGGPSREEYVTGWITKFFPYVPQGEKFRKREDLNSWLKPDEFPKGIAKADFYWVFPVEGITYQMQFMAGFMGVKFDRATNTLRPEIGWAIRDTGVQGIKDEDKKYEHDILTPKEK